MTIRIPRALSASVLLLGALLFCGPAVPSLQAQLIVTGDSVSLEAAIANQLVASTAQVVLLNADLLSRCNTAITNFNTNMASGQPNVNSKPPLPPFAWVLTDPKLSGGFTFYEQSKSDRITCTVIPSTFNAGGPQPAKPPNVIDVLQPAFYGKWHAVGPNDTFPVGMTTPPMPPDNAIYQKFGAPVGPGWYLQVN